ncbi:stage II sporulation protein R [Paenibacillus pinistramenti]|uniref:stage II sporulation protein R n=1 Tax=Paenibacillus pinistramenti TaxID=1768003 RepID=UPI001EEFEFF4|nr:stage II sporulation protein R [Paenibacillus pinistramenti]
MNKEMKRGKGNMMKTVLLLGFSLMILLMSWDNQKTDAAAVNTEIPSESIRLRILADSDDPGDQLVKRKVRDAVVEQMNGWVQALDNPQSLEQARAVIRGHLPEIEQLVGNVLQANGQNYGYKVELGIVPFPAKLYGGEVYPAGNYEALRITLGSGQGQNWWCVLFPPLCFIDGGSGDALAKSSEVQTASAASASKEVKTAKADAGDSTAAQTEAGKAQPPEVHFFLWDLLKEFWGWVTGIFA